MSRKHPDLENIIAGALYDFAGFLTTLNDPVTLGSAEPADRMVVLLSAFARIRDLSLSEPYVEDWNQWLYQGHEHIARRGVDDDEKDNPPL